MGAPSPKRKRPCRLFGRIATHGMAAFLVAEGRSNRPGTSPPRAFLFSSAASPRGPRLSCCPAGRITRPSTGRWSALHGLADPSGDARCVRATQVALVIRPIAPPLPPCQTGAEPGRRTRRECPAGPVERWRDAGPSPRMERHPSATTTPSAGRPVSSWAAPASLPTVIPGRNGSISSKSEGLAGRRRIGRPAPMPRTRR